MKSKVMFLCPRCAEVFKAAGFRLVPREAAIRAEKCDKCGKKRYGERFEVQNDT